MRISLAFALTAFPILLVAQERAQPDWRFAHPDATMVGGIRPSTVLDSPLLAAALADATKKDPSTAAMIGMAGGFLSGVTEIRFSLVDNGTPEPDVIALVSGRLDDVLVSMLAQEKAKSRRIDANTLLLGNGDSLDKAVQRMSESAPVLQSRVLDGIQPLGGYDFWISGKLPRLPITDSLKLNLRGLALGLSMHDNVEMELAMDAATPAMAESLIRSAHEAEATQAAQFKGKLLSSLDGTTARFRLNIPRELAIDAMRSNTRTTQPALSASSAGTPLPPQPKPRRQTIVIQGLDSGPREIPLQ